MILTLFVAIPLACAFLAWVTGRLGPTWSRWITLLGNLATLALALALWASMASGALVPGDDGFLAEVSLPWIPQAGISFTLRMDGLSLLMLGLTAFLGVTSVLASWSGIRDKVWQFHVMLSLVLAGIYGVFLALDLFLFAFFWELMLIPMYFLIDLWGHEGRHHAAVKFFLFTQIGGLLMFAAIVALAVIHSLQVGAITFDYALLMNTRLTPAAEMILMLGFFAAFAVKLPAFPFHAWLPDAHTAAPTAGSVILAGLLLKTGGYGLIRFVVPLFPEAAIRFAPIAMWMGAVGIVYGGLMALVQTDMKRLVAYTSVSHLGFVLMGVFALNARAVTGAVIQMLSHGLSTGALFILVGSLQDRMHTRELSRMGGLWPKIPRAGFIAMVLVMALVGLPGLGNFIGEFFVLLGSWQAIPAAAVVGGAGLVIAMVYALRMLQLSFFGAPREDLSIRDLTAVEVTAMGAMIAALVWLGLFPGGAVGALSAMVLGGAK